MDGSPKMIEIAAFEIQKFLYQLPESLRQHKNPEGERNITAQLDVTVKIPKGEGRALVTVEVKLESQTCIQADVEILSVNKKEIESTKQLFESGQARSILLKFFSSIANNINWLLMNTPVGPLPLTGHVIVNALLQNKPT